MIPTQASLNEADSEWMTYAGLVESGDPQSSRSVDEIVYGDENSRGGVTLER